jgi:hypothetical protein
MLTKRRTDRTIKRDFAGVSGEAEWFVIMADGQCIRQSQESETDPVFSRPDCP